MCLQTFALNFVLSFVYSFLIVVFVLGWKVKLVTCRIRLSSNQCHSNMIVIILIPNKAINRIRNGSMQIQNIRMIRQPRRRIILVNRLQMSRGPRRPNESEFCVFSQLVLSCPHSVYYISYL